jgi:hypothetical protein
MRGGDASEDGGGGWSTGKRRWQGNDVPSRPTKNKPTAFYLKRRKSKLYNLVLRTCKPPPIMVVRTTAKILPVRTEPENSPPGLSRGPRYH